MKHRAVIIGAGRIGAGFNWTDDAYTHAGAYEALGKHVELVGFVDPDQARLNVAHAKWGFIDTYLSLKDCLENSDPIDIFSICVQPEQQPAILELLAAVKPAGVWCEKPYMGERLYLFPIQVNYLRRGDHQHQWMAEKHPGGLLRVHGKDDIHTVCHFKDLAKWWKADLEYHPQEGSCHYYYNHGEDWYAFPNGGLENPGDAMKAMLGNLLDHIDKGDPLWSPPT